MDRISQEWREHTFVGRVVNQIPQKDREREEIAQDVARFLANGGVIQKPEFGTLADPDGKLPIDGTYASRRNLANAGAQTELTATDSKCRKALDMIAKGSTLNVAAKELDLTEAALGKRLRKHFCKDYDVARKSQQSVLQSRRIEQTESKRRSVCLEVIERMKRGQSLNEIAPDFRVNRTTLGRWLERYYPAEYAQYKQKPGRDFGHTNPGASKKGKPLVFGRAEGKAPKVQAAYQTQSAQNYFSRFK